MSYHGSLCDLYSSTICLKRRRSRSMTLSPLITIFRIRTAGDNIINCSHTETHTKRSNMHWHAGEFQFYITFRDIWWMTGGWMWWRRSQSVGQAVADIRFKLVLIGDVAMGNGSSVWSAATKALLQGPVLPRAEIQYRPGLVRHVENAISLVNTGKR